MTIEQVTNIIETTDSTEPMPSPEGASADPEVGWNDYFAKHEDVKPEAVRETALAVDGRAIHS